MDTAKLDAAQTAAYLRRLEADAPEAPTRAALDKLICAHQMHVPFETIGVHREGTPDLALDAIFAKVVEQNRGAYCFELNKLFQALLASLGFSVRPVLCRAVRGREGRMPINHRGMLVELDGTQFFADVGFGGPMPSGALELASGVSQDINGETYLTETADGIWWQVDRITQAARDLFDDGVPARRQTEMEICTATVEELDFDALNAFCSQPGTLFRDHEVVNLRTQGGYRGWRDGVLTLREGAEKKVMECTTEEERAQALRDHFGLIYD